MPHSNNFYVKTRHSYESFLSAQKKRFPREEQLKIDLHCHDKNSNVPDELWGRLLRLPETWLETKQLVETLERNGTDLITITNHNNARSCWNLLDMGMDLLVGTEYTCHFPDSELSIHILAYGFSPEQEFHLNRLRHNIFDFLRYTREQDIVTVQPHPLFFYTYQVKPDMAILEKFAVLFQRYEVLNGQRGYWQNNLTRLWVESLTPEVIEACAQKHNLNPFDFCADPFNKSLTGGSDDHNGIFAGRTGTLVHVPDLKEKLRGSRRSDLILEAIREGRTAPYGEVGEEEKLTVTFLDYFSQVAMHMEDPGLLRMLLHRGTLKDKVMCLGISNVMQELKRHKYTLTFLKTFHESLHGTKPALLTSLGVTKEFKPTLKVVKEIAKTQRKEPDRFLEVIRKAVPEIYQSVTDIFFKRLNQHLAQMETQSIADVTADELIRKFEIPTQFRALFSSETSIAGNDMTQLNLSKLLDEVTFPALASAVIAGASFAASQVIYSNRDFLNELADQLGEGGHPKKALWLTDTFVDHNGVSSVLQNTLKEIQKHNYPIDILTCHCDLKPQDHLLVVKPINQFSVQSLGEQVFNLPDLLQIQRIFERGGYDRIICSTEAMMGPVALYLKKAFSVPAYFFMHTDWMEFVQRTTRLNLHERDRIRRMLRAFYQQFNGTFTLNSDHRAWLTSPEMGLDEQNVFLTRHWVDQQFHNKTRKTAVRQKAPVLLYVGRVSGEKGVFDLVDVMKRIQVDLPDAQLWIAGTGPASKQLEIAIPQAKFLGWQDSKELHKTYLQADILLLPSRFDTFGCVILEALSSGLPSVSYNCKGPKDIIEHETNGFLVESPQEMAEAVIRYWHNPELHETFRTAALERSQCFNPKAIMTELLADIGLTDQE